MLAELDDVEGFAADVREQGFQDVVLLGMGGSSLAPEVLRRSFGQRAGDRPRLHVLDSTDAGGIRAVQDAIDPQRTLFVVSSKSGGTIEPLSLFAHFWSLVRRRRATSSRSPTPARACEELAREHGFRQSLRRRPRHRRALQRAVRVRHRACRADGRRLRALLRARAARGRPALATAGDARARRQPAQQAAAVLAGRRAERARARRAGQAHVRDLRVAARPRACGSSSSSPSRPASTARASCRSPTSRSASPRVYGEDRVFAYLPDLGAPEPALDARVAALARGRASA